MLFYCAPGMCNNYRWQGRLYRYARSCERTGSQLMTTFLLEIYLAVGVGFEPTRGSWLNTKSGGQPRSAELVVWSTLYSVYPVVLTPETRGHVCRRVSSPHSIKSNYYSAILKNKTIRCKYFN